VITCGCSKEATPDDGYLKKPVCQGSFMPKQSPYQVVGFYTSWREEILHPDQIDWARLTRVIYAFAIPNADGTINTAELHSISELTENAHANGVEVYLSVGGGDGSGSFPVMAKNEKTRTRFVKEVRQYLFANCLDGVDIDWEYWTGSETGTVIPAESSAFVNLLKELREALEPFGLGISVDLGNSDWWGKHYFDGVAQYADHLMVMSYDFTGTWSDPGPHSSFEDAIGSGNTVSSTGLAYYTGYRGWPKNKILLGVPFYGKDFDIGGGLYMSYADILAGHPEAYKYDQVNNIYFNGIPTIRKKAEYVRDNAYSGVMIWELTQDSGIDTLSLLNTIGSVLSP
jgi:GH18 family chitinase